MTQLAGALRRQDRRRVLVALVCALASLSPLTDVHTAAAAGAPWVVYAVTGGAAGGGPESVVPVPVGQGAQGPIPAPNCLGSSACSIALSPDGRTAYVVNGQTFTVIDLTTGTTLGSTGYGKGDQGGAIAVSPDGRTAYVTDLFDQLFDIIDVTNPQHPTSTARPASSPVAVAASPDGSTVYVVSEDEHLYSFHPGGTVLAAVATIGNTPRGIVISPDGSMAYVLTIDAPGVTPVILANGSIQPRVSLASAANNPLGIAVSPDGSAVYVADANNSVFRVVNGAATRVALPDRTQPQALVMAPDGRNIYAVGFGGVINRGPTMFSITNPASAGPQISSLPGGRPISIAMTPDQAPVANFAATPGVVGQPTTFDASASTVKYGTISDYAWNFGDGSPVTHTSTPTITHVYAAAGPYNPSVTETDSAGTSLSRVFTGQTMLRNGGPPAQGTISISVPPPTSTTNPTTGTTNPTTGTTGTTTPTTTGTTPTTTAATPTLAVSPTVGPPGQVVQVKGSGFPADTSLTLAWQPGIGTFQATTDALGGLQTSVLVFPHDELGPTQLVAQGTSASAAFLVVQAPGEPGGRDALVLYRR